MNRTQTAVQIKVVPQGEMLLARWKSSLYARTHMTVEQVYRQIQKSGSVASPNRFYNGQNKPELSYQLLASAD